MIVRRSRNHCQRRISPHPPTHPPPRLPHNFFFLEGGRGGLINVLPVYFYTSLLFTLYTSLPFYIRLCLLLIPHTRYTSFFPLFFFFFFTSLYILHSLLFTARFTVFNKHLNIKINVSKPPDHTTIMNAAKVSNVSFCTNNEIQTQS